MDVTRDNFAEAADELEGLLATCKFVAFDEEMTGIRLDHSTEPAWCDTVEERYAKMKRVAEHFLLMQVGICVFHEEEVAPGPAGEGAPPATRLVARPFNFYVFPAPRSKHQLRMTADTAQFHVEHEMDFNKWIKHGVPFMSAEQYDLASERLLAAEAPPSQSSERKKVVISRPDDIKFMEAAFAGLDAWIKGNAQEEGQVEQEGGVEGADANGQEKEASMEVDGASGKAAGAQQNEFEMPDCNPFLRRAMYEKLEEDYPALTAESRAVTEGGSSPRKKVVVLRLTDEEREKRAAEKKKDKLKALDESAGFLRIFRMLSAAGKPMVGHNCLYDLMFLYSHFQGSLPDSAADFKQALHAIFPHLWDTKHISSHSAGKYSDTQLGPLYQKCLDDDTSARVVVAMGSGFEKYAAALQGGGAAHEAAYDAYMTGVVLAKLMGDGFCAPDAAKQNRMYLMRSLFSLNLTGADDVVEEGTLLHLSGFDAAFKTLDLVALFGRLRVQIRWINDSSCIAVVCDPRPDPEAAPAAEAEQGAAKAPAKEEEGRSKEDKEREARELVAANLPAVVAQVEGREAQGGGNEEEAARKAAAPAIVMSSFKVSSIHEWVASAAAPRLPVDAAEAGGASAGGGGVQGELPACGAAECGGSAVRAKSSSSTARAGRVSEPEARSGGGLEAELAAEKAKVAGLTGQVARLQQQLALLSSPLATPPVAETGLASQPAPTASSMSGARSRVKKGESAEAGPGEPAAGDSGSLGQGAARKPQRASKRKASDMQAAASTAPCDASPKAPTRSSARRKN